MNKSRVQSWQNGGGGQEVPNLQNLRSVEKVALGIEAKGGLVDFPNEGFVPVLCLTFQMPDGSKTKEVVIPPQLGMPMVRLLSNWMCRIQDVNEQAQMELMEVPMAADRLGMADMVEAVSGE